MTHERLLVVDIETVPDRELIPADWAEDKFPKPIWHKVVAVAVASARIERTPGGERYVLEDCRAGGQLHYTEPELLKSFWRYFDGQKARVVTWNGKGFDFPVLKLRPMVHGLSAVLWHTAGDRWQDYAARRRLR
jgi:predicted PolB exonuclease-like 3'-5' exonuclease